MGRAVGLDVGFAVGLFVGFSVGFVVEIYARQKCMSYPIIRLTLSRFVDDVFYSTRCTIADNKVPSTVYPNPEAKRDKEPLLNSLDSAEIA